MKEFRVEAYTNSLGQVIQPGEDVIYAGTSYKSTTFRAAKFAGVYYGPVRKYVNRVDENGNVILNKWNLPDREVVTEIKPVAVKVTDVIDDVWDRENKKYVRAIRLRPAILDYKRVYKKDTNITSLEGTSF